MPAPDEVGSFPEEAPAVQTAAATSTGTAAEAGGFGGAFRDREPPPAYAGEDPETSFAIWEKNVRLWEYETDVPVAKRGVKLLKVLSGTARLAVDEISFEEVACEAGIRNIMAKLKEYFLPHLEVSLPRAFEAAVYGQVRGSKEGFMEYIARQDKAFTRLRKEGVELPDSAQGYILFRHASLNESQEQRFLVWSDGKYDRVSVVKALRKLDKVIREKGVKSSFLGEEAEANNETFFEDAEDEGWLEEGENFVYLQEGDLNEVMNEDDVVAALATYQDVRRAMKEQQKGRGFYGKGNQKGKFNGKGKGRWQKFHVEQLKLRTRCWRCNQVGHISTECKNEPAPRSNQSVASGGTTSTSRSGFFVVSDPKPFQEAEHSFASSSQVEVSEKGHFWLKEFVDDRAKTSAAAESCEGYKSAQSGFCGITTSAEHGVVDTAAEGGLVGKCALERLEEKLRRIGLTCTKTNRQTSAKGVGGQAKVHGVVLIPIGVGGVSGVLEATVVEGDVPLLLPVKMMRHLRTVLDLDCLTFFMKEFDVTIPMFELPSGHVTIDIFNFGSEGFVLPEGVPECSQEDFSYHMENQQNNFCAATAMLAQPTKCSNSCPRSLSTADGHGELAGSDEADGDASSRAGELCRRDGRWVSTPPKESNSRMEGDSRQNHHPFDVLRAPTHRGGMVSTIYALAGFVVCQQGGDLGGCVCRADQGGSTFGAPQGQANCTVLSSELCASEASSQRWRQCGSLLHRVQGMRCSLGERDEGCGHQEAVEGEQGKSWGSLESTYGAGEPGVCRELREAGHGTSAKECRDTIYDQSGGAEELPGRRKDEDSGGAEAAQDGAGEAEEGCVGEREEERGADQKLGGRGQASCNSGHPGRCPSRNLSEGDEVQVRETSRTSDGQEGRPKEGQELLEVCAARVRSVSMDANGTGGRNRECEVGARKLLHGDVDTRNIEEVSKSTTKEIEEPEEKHSGYPREERFSCPGGVGRGGSVDEMEHGSWSYASTSRARGIIRRLQCEKEKRGPGGWVEIGPKYEVLENSCWVARTGVVPVEESREVRVWVAKHNRGKMEDAFEGDKVTHFAKKDRKKLNKKIEHLFGQWEPVVSEVYSPPRVAAEASRHGMKAGSSFDLKTGWDLSKAEDRKDMWRSLKEEKPSLLVLCPPCHPFSVLQELNFDRMGMERSIALVKTGLEHLELAAALAKWQVNRGGYVVLEQPLGARSWNEECLQKLLRLPGVCRVRCDMCAYGMSVTGEGLNKKPTGVLTNSQCVAEELSRRCTEDHEHVNLMEGRAKRAEEYPKAFCQAMVKGIRRQLKQDGVFCWHQDGKVQYVLAGEEGFEDEEEEEPLEEIGGSRGSEAVIGERPEDAAITDQEKEALQKLHRGVGHPSLADFIRFMKAARVRGEVVRWASKNFRCEACEAKPRPKSCRPATVPKTYQPNKVIGIDLIYIPSVGGQSLVPALSMLDWGSNYQMVELVENKEPQTIWKAWWSTWIRTFGLPEILVCDAGKEFASEFIKKATANGVVVYQIGARAPWQNGKTERHGMHYKELLEKARLETVLTDERELKLMMQEIEMVKNRYSNRSGFSPVQRQIGQWPRAPTELMSDEAIDPLLVSGALVDDLERLHDMRRIAQKAFVEGNAREAVKKIERTRSRTSVRFEAGDYVYVYRVHRQRKRRGDGPQDIDYAKNKPTWVGPGTVVAVDGANLWVTVWGELWKVAREQCRPATNMEKHGVELVMRECIELVEDYKKTSRRTGYKDLCGEPWPEEEEAEDEREGEDERERRVRFDEEAIEYAPTEYEPNSEGVEEESQPLQEVGEEEERRRASRESTQTVPEPEREATVIMDDDELEGAQSEGVSGTGVPSHEQMTDPAFQQAMRDSEELGRRVDGVNRGQWRTRSRSNPYMTEVYFVTPEEMEEDDMEGIQERLTELVKTGVKASRGGDYWTVDLEGGSITKHHMRKRRAMFNPKDDRDLPMRLRDLRTERVTELTYACNRPSERLEDDWQTGRSRSTRDSHWKGTTTFFMKVKPEPEEIEAMKVLLAEKRRTDDVDMRKESDRDLEEWKVADKSEWIKVAESGAVRVLSLEESRAITQELRMKNKLDRILPTKIARRYKPSEQPGTPATKKSRLCLRGDKDPDILSLERFSPTVNTMNLAVMMQIAANENMLAQIGDLKNAFCQSDPLHRENGPLYFKQPPEGIDGMHPEQIVLIIAGCYGLVDAPLHWRKSLTEALTKLGYEQSRLDPCIYKCYEKGRLQGMIAIEVDDLFMVGHETHLRKLECLKNRFVFGKFVTLKECPEGAMFNGRRLKQLENGEFQVDMQKFVEERLQEVELEKGRRSMKKAEATEEEKSQARAACGALNWLSKEGRPDASGPSSLLSSRLTDLRIEDIIQLNEVIKALKQKSDLAIRVQPSEKMKMSVVSDASFGNDRFHSQGGQMIICHEDGLQENKQVAANLLCWRSGRIQRVVNSTLAAETQSLSRGIGDLLWVLVLFEELQDENFSIRDWPSRLSGKEVMALASKSSSDDLKGCLAIVDAKSLYDYLCKETIGGQDKRTAIEIQIIREDLNSLSGKIRWVDHPAMLADGLTKVKGSNDPLYSLLSTGRFKLTAESQHMEARSLAKEGGQSVNDIRRFGINKKVGSCESKNDECLYLIPNMAP